MIFFTFRPLFSDDSWDAMDAKVICRMLGFDPTNSVATKQSAFGEVSSDFILDDVQCDGDEHNILECTHSKTHNCNPREGAGVICESTGNLKRTYSELHQMCPIFHYSSFVGLFR